MSMMFCAFLAMRGKYGLFKPKDDKLTNYLEA
jgi:hypothetical protein